MKAKTIINRILNLVSRLKNNILGHIENIKIEKMLIGQQAGYPLERWIKESQEYGRISCPLINSPYVSFLREIEFNELGQFFSSAYEKNLSKISAELEEKRKNLEEEKKNLFSQLYDLEKAELKNKELLERIKQIAKLWYALGISWKI